MASIIKRGAHQFQVQIRRKGYPAKQLTFETRRRPLPRPVLGLAEGV